MAWPDETELCEGLFPQPSPWMIMQEVPSMPDMNGKAELLDRI
jgi:hypothetical protein